MQDTIISPRLKGAWKFVPRYVRKILCVVKPVYYQRI
jgi:hypothetical protein